MDWPLATYSNPPFWRLCRTLHFLEAPVGWPRTSYIDVWVASQYDLKGNEVFSSAASVESNDSHSLPKRWTGSKTLVKFLPKWRHYYCEHYAVHPTLISKVLPYIRPPQNNSAISALKTPKELQRTFFQFKGKPADLLMPRLQKLKGPLADLLMPRLQTNSVLWGMSQTGVHRSGTWFITCNFDWDIKERTIQEGNRPKPRWSAARFFCFTTNSTVAFPKRKSHGTRSCQCGKRKCCRPSRSRFANSIPGSPRRAHTRRRPKHGKAVSKASKRGNPGLVEPLKQKPIEEKSTCLICSVAENRASKTFQKYYLLSSFSGKWTSWEASNMPNW